MKKIVLLTVVLSILGFTSCDISDDQELCSTGPVLIMLDIVQDGTNNNLFSNDTFQQADFSVVDNEGDDMDYNFLTIDGRVYVRINLGEQTGDRTITLNFNSEENLDIEYIMAVSSGSCANNYITDFDIPGYDFEQSPTSGVIRVYYQEPTT